MIGSVCRRPRPASRASWRASCRSWLGSASVLLLLVVACAADVVVGGQGGRGLGRLLEGQLVEAGGEDVGNGLVAWSAKAFGPGARHLDPRGTMTLSEADDPQARAVALLGMGPGPEDLGDDAARGRPRLLGPGDQTRGGPLGMRPVGGRHVFGEGGVAAPAPQTHVRGDAVGLVQDLYCARRGTRLDVLALELVRDAVVVVVELDVVVDVHTAVLPLGHLEAVRGQSSQCGTVQALKQLAAGGAKVSHRAAVEIAELLPDRLVHLD